jgi:hypothetical protein
MPGRKTAAASRSLEYPIYGKGVNGLVLQVFQKTRISENITRLRCGGFFYKGAVMKRYVLFFLRDPATS